jgi:uncharacterized protein YbjT (DUF2867 family)
MILITGGTGFVGRVLVKQLTEKGETLRLLLRPSPRTPALPRSTSIEVAVSSLKDQRSLRAAMKDVDVIYHLASDERRGLKADLTGVDIEGTQNLVEAAKQARVKRIFFLSHLGADRASAYAVLKAKAIAEGFITRSGLDYTIFRSAIIYGPHDQFTTSLARLLKLSPGIVFIPGDSNSLLQPISVEDIVACMTWSLDRENTRNQLYRVGGSEYFSLRQIMEKIQEVTRRKRWLVSLSPVYIRTLTLILDQFIPRFPISIYWLDYVASDRICPLDILPRIFGIMPARFNYQLDYLKGV